MAETRDEGRTPYAMDFTDQVGEWRAVLDAMAKRETHPYRVKKLNEIREALKDLRYRADPSGDVGEATKLWEQSVAEGRECVAWVWAGPEYSDLKLCPKCGAGTLEGFVECSKCGHEPADDSTWREVASAYLARPRRTLEDTP